MSCQKKIQSMNSLVTLIALSFVLMSLSGACYKSLTLSLEGNNNVCEVTSPCTVYCSKWFKGCGKTFTAQLPRSLFNSICVLGGECNCANLENKVSLTFNRLGASPWVQDFNTEYANFQQKCQTSCLLYNKDNLIKNFNLVAPRNFAQTSFKVLEEDEMDE
jgi:hypothetical protein